MILERVEPKEKCRRENGVAYCHFQPCVVTLNGVATKERGVPDVRSCTHERGLAHACMGGQRGGVETDLLEFSVTTKNFLSQQR